MGKEERMRTDKKERTAGILGFLFNLVLYFAAYGGLCGTFFNGDTLATIADPAGQASGYLGSGRYLYALVYEAGRAMGIDWGNTTGVNVFFAIILIAAGSTLISHTFAKAMEIKKESKAMFAVYLAVAFSFLNLLSLELLYFGAYALVPGIAILLMAFALHYLQKNKYAPALLFFILMIMTYQSFVGYFICYGLLLIYLEYRGRLQAKSFWKSGILVMVSGVICIADIYSVTLFGKLGWLPLVHKHIEAANPVDIFRTIIEVQINILKTEYSLSAVPYLPFLLVLTAGIGILYAFVTGKKSVSQWVYLILLAVVSDISCFAVLFGGYLYVPPRIVVSYWGFISMLLLLCLYELQKKAATPVLAKIPVAAMVLMTLVHIVNANLVVSGLYVSNALDRNYARSVVEAIERYEQENNTEIHSIYIGRDSNCSVFWKDYVSYYNYNINERCVSGDWQLNILLKLESGRTFERADIPQDIYEAAFKDKNWDNLNLAEQLVFQDDTAYLCVY